MQLESCMLVAISGTGTPGWSPVAAFPLLLVATNTAFA